MLYISVVFLAADVESYDYVTTNWLGAGLSVSAFYDYYFYYFSVSYLLCRFRSVWMLQGHILKLMRRAVLSCLELTTCFVFHWKRLTPHILHWLKVLIREIATAEMK